MITQATLSPLFWRCLLGFLDFVSVVSLFVQVRDDKKFYTIFSYGVVSLHANDCFCYCSWQVFIGGYMLKTLARSDFPL